MTFIVGLIVGIALGTIVVAFLALSAYERGYDAATSSPWRTELRARQGKAVRRHRAFAA
jgi:hypothetical protein